MRITLIVEDLMIRLNSFFRKIPPNLDLKIDKNISAIQWFDDNTGYIEYKDKENYPNKKIGEEEKELIEHLIQVFNASEPEILSNEPSFSMDYPPLPNSDINLSS